MHGQRKLITSEEKKAALKLQVAENIKAYMETVHACEALRQAKVYTREGLDSTSAVLGQNPDYYSIWNYRRQCLLALKNVMTREEYIEVLKKGELKFTIGCIERNPKSYCTWHHREWVTKDLNSDGSCDWAKELALCVLFLSKDNRNFHGWNYRRYCAIQAGEVDKELPYTRDVIAKDFANYSAWQYRSKLLPASFEDSGSTSTSGTGSGSEAQVLKGERKLVLDAVFTDPSVQSPWLYHRWIIGRSTEVEGHLLSGSLTSSTGGEGTSRVFLSFSRVVEVCSDQVRLVSWTVPPTCEGGSSPPSPVSLPAAIEWKAAHNLYGSTHCDVWVGLLPLPTLALTFTVSLRTGTVSNKTLESSVTLKANEGTFLPTHTSAENRGGDVASAVSPPSLAEIIHPELEDLSGLMEMEPDSKWVLLSHAFLYRQIGRHDEAVRLLTSLLDIDKDHLHYYNDLLSAIRMDEAVSAAVSKVGGGQAPLTFSLANLALTTVSMDSMRLLLGTTALDLSGNALSRLEGAHLLPNLVVLNLSNNLLTTLPASLGTLSCLRVLRLTNNHLKKADDILRVLSGSPLEELYLDGNECASALSAAGLATHLPNLKTLQL